MVPASRKARTASITIVPERITALLSGLVRLASALRAFLVGGLLLPALVAHDALALVVLRSGGVVLLAVMTFVTTYGIFADHAGFHFRFRDDPPEAKRFQRRTKNQVPPVARVRRPRRAVR